VKWRAVTSQWIGRRAGSVCTNAVNRDNVSWQIAQIGGKERT